MKEFQYHTEDCICGCGNCGH